MANMSRVIKRSVNILVMLLLAVLIGCDGGATAKVGIVDIEQVATRLGRDAELKKLAGNVEQELNTYRTTLRERLDEDREKLGESPTEEQQAESAKQLQEANQKFANAQAQARQRIQFEQLKLLKQISDEVQSHIRTLAVQKGLTLVLKQGDYIMAAQPMHDITNDVINQIKATPTYVPSADSVTGAQPPSAVPSAGAPLPETGALPPVTAPSP